MKQTDWLQCLTKNCDWFKESCNCQTWIERCRHVCGSWHNWAYYIIHHSSYLCRRVLPLIDCEVEQVLGGSTEAQETSDAGALFKVSKLLVKLRNVETRSDFWLQGAGYGWYGSLVPKCPLSSPWNGKAKSQTRHKAYVGRVVNDSESCGNLRES